MTRPRPSLIRRLTALALALVATLTIVQLVAPSEAQAHRTVTLYEYDGQHPIPEPFEGWCEDQELHVHSYYLDPADYAVYEVDGVIHFMGDPTFYGWSGDVNWYYDPHPVAHIDHHWCVLEGPHTHVWGPSWDHRHYGRRYWSVYDRYYVYTGLYDGWFTWSWDLYYSRVWGVHVRVVNRWAPRYRSYHPVYT